MKIKLNLIFVCIISSLSCRSNKEDTLDSILNKYQISNNRIYEPFKKLLKLYRENKNVNCFDPKTRENLWTFATQIKNNSLLKELIKKKDNSLINKANKAGKYPLQLAIDSNNVNAIEMLLDAGSSINIPFKKQENNLLAKFNPGYNIIKEEMKKGNCAFKYSINKCSSYETIRLILEKTNIDINSKVSHIPLIHLFFRLAVFCKSGKRLINYLLNKPNINLNLKLDRGKNILMEAAQLGDLEILKKVWKKIDWKKAKFDINTKSNDGVTALHYTTLNKNISKDVIDFLLSHKAEINLGMNQKNYFKFLDKITPSKFKVDVSKIKKPLYKFFTTSQEYIEEIKKELLEIRKKISPQIYTPVHNAMITLNKNALMIFINKRLTEKVGLGNSTLSHMIDRYIQLKQNLIELGPNKNLLHQQTVSLDIMEAIIVNKNYKITDYEIQQINDSLQRKGNIISYWRIMVDKLKNIVRFKSTILIKTLKKELEKSNKDDQRFALCLIKIFLNHSDLNNKKNTGLLEIAEKKNLNDIKKFLKEKGGL